MVEKVLGDEKSVQTYPKTQQKTSLRRFEGQTQMQKNICPVQRAVLEV